MSNSITKFLIMNIRNNFARIGILIVSVSFALMANTFAQGFTNVTVANVTPFSFTVLWLGSGASPQIDIFADENGASNITSQLEAELYPLKAGSPLISSDYEQRGFKSILKQEIQSKKISIIKVSGCKPDTRYYCRISHIFNNLRVHYPEFPPYLSVKTMLENSFIVDSKQLFIEFDNEKSLGSVILLSHPDTQYPLIAIVGDGCPTNKAAFNISDFFFERC